MHRLAGTLSSTYYRKMSPADRMGDAVLRIGDWTAIPARNALVRAGTEVRLEPRLMDALVVLVERAPHPVSRQELIDGVWQRQFVSDDTLAVTISALRRALGDDARQPRYIETVSRRGYRLIARIERHDPTNGIGNAASGPAVRRRIAPRRVLLAGAVAIALVVSAAAAWRSGLTYRPHTPAPEAYDAYLTGRRFLDQRSISGWQQALDNFRRAAVLDDRYPAAHAGVADAYTAMSDFGVASPAEMRPLAMRAARRALDLDDRSAEAHEAMGRALFLFDWNFARAGQSLQRSIALDSAYMPAWQALAWLHSARGEHAAAIVAARRALQLDPVNEARYLELAYVLGLAGRAREANVEVERAIRIEPSSWLPYITRGWLFEIVNAPDSAFASYRRAWEVSGISTDSLRMLDALYRSEGLRGYYRSWVRTRVKGGPLSETWTAQLYLRLGQRDSAIAALQRAFDRREGALAWVNVEPLYAPLRGDPRFRRIAAGLAEVQ